MQRGAYLERLAEAAVADEAVVAVQAVHGDDVLARHRQRRRPPVPARVWLPPRRQQLVLKLQHKRTILLPQ